MTIRDWGIGVPGALGAEAIGTLAELAEQLGYRSFWFNCVAPHADPTALLDTAMSRTNRVEIGIGVVPLNGYPAPALAAGFARGRADDPRVVIGVGSGSTRLGAIQRVRDGIGELRRALPNARVAVGGKGPRMVATGSELADALLFSMLTPDEAATITAGVDKRRPGAQTYNYHRVAIDPDAADRVRTEMVAHGVTPGRDGAPDLLGTVLPARDARAVLQADLAAYPADWLAVLRPLPPPPAALDDWREMFVALAPAAV